MGGGPHGGMGAGEKAKDFKGTIRKLMKYLSEYKIGLSFCSPFLQSEVRFLISQDPKFWEKRQQRVFTGLVGKVSGGSGIDFEKIAHILIFLMCLYVTSAIFSFIQGYIMTGVSQKLTYRLRKEISEKINRMP